MDWKSALIEVGAEVTTHQDADAFPRSFTFNEAQLLAFLALAKAEAVVVGDWEGERIKTEFPDYAHTRYLGCHEENGKWHYSYDTEVIYLLEEFLAQPTE